MKRAITVDADDVLVLHPGDILVLRYAQVLSPAKASEISARIEGRLGVRTLVVEADGAEIRPAEAAAP